LRSISAVITPDNGPNVRYVHAHPSVFPNDVQRAFLPLHVMCGPQSLQIQFADLASLAFSKLEKRDSLRRFIIAACEKDIFVFDSERMGSLARVGPLTDHTRLNPNDRKFRIATRPRHVRIQPPILIIRSFEPPPDMAAILSYRSGRVRSVDLACHRIVVERGVIPAGFSA
jgi:hypothetical protein